MPTHPNPYRQGLARNAANHVPLSPISLVDWAADVFPDRLALIHGSLRLSLGKLTTREDLDAALTALTRIVAGLRAEPPRVLDNQTYAVMVPAVDADGNDLGGVRMPTVDAPLGTYTGWNLRAQGGGCFVQIAAATGVHPRAGLAWYSGSMGGVIATCKAMAVDLGRDGIRVNVVNPLPDDSDPRGEYAGATDTAEQRARLKAAVPLGRLPSALDVANAALFLASDEARCITGACLAVDGGHSL